MKTENQFKQDILVWSIIVGIFAALTMLAVNFSRIRGTIESRFEQNRGHMEMKAPDPQLQPGYTVVLAQ